MLEKTMFYGASSKIFENAKILRNNMTFAEKKLWEELKTKKMNGFRFKAQHPIHKYIADFYCHKVKLVIEIDGSVHENDVIKERDDGRDFEMENFGLTILRFSNTQVINNIEEVITEIKKYL